MTPTKEQQAQEYAEKVNYPCPDYGWYESDDEQMKECLADTFKAGANYVYGLPLASRLTAEEKERVRKAYKAMSDYGENKGVECASCANYAARVWMERIFGSDFFKEGE